MSKRFVHKWQKQPLQREIIPLKIKARGKQQDLTFTDIILYQRRFRIIELHQHFGILRGR